MGKWDWCPNCLPQVGEGERLTGLHGDPCGFQASPSAMDVPFPPGPAGAKVECDRQALRAAGVALRGARSPGGPSSRGSVTRLASFGRTAMPLTWDLKTGPGGTWSLWLDFSTEMTG